MLISLEINVQSPQETIKLLMLKRGSQDAVTGLQLVPKTAQLDMAHLQSKVLALEGIIHLYIMADDTGRGQACKQHFAKK